MDKVHCIKLIVVDLEENLTTEEIIGRFDDSMNGTASNGFVKGIHWSCKDYVHHDEDIFNTSVSSTELQYHYNNLNDDEYQTYLKLKEKFEK